MDHEDEKAVTVGGKLGMPGFGELSASYSWKRKRIIDRGNEMIEVAIEQAGRSREELANRLEAEEELADTFWLAIERGSSKADPHYRRALARLIARALDGARIDEIGHLVDQLCKLDPLHLRVLFNFYKPNHWVSAPNRQPWFEPVPSLDEADVLNAQVTDEPWSLGDLQLEPSLHEGALQVLYAAGFLDKKVTSDSGELLTMPLWFPTLYAATAMRAMFPKVTHVK